jgi:hypothetical protein
MFQSLFRRPLAIAASYALLLTLLLSLLTACSLTPTSTPTSHETYRYAQFVMPSDANVHPGDQITLTWEARPDGDSTEAGPTQVTINADLLGPFPSVAAVQEAIQQLNSSGQSCSLGPGTVVTSITPIQTDNWTNKTYTRTLQLPSSLTPGYYELVQRVSNTGCARGPFEIKPRGK